LGSHGLRDSGPGLSRVSHQRRSCPAENEPIPELKGISAVNPQPVGGLEHEFYDFPYIGNFIIPTDFHIFERGGSTTNQFKFDIW